MGSIEERVLGLVRDAELSAEGGFSIDQEQARAKLRQFQLSDPRRYVLLVVQAAVHLGATRIDFAIDTNDVRARFDGQSLLADDLRQLQRSLFVHQTDPRSRALHALALAVNAAMALHPRFVRVRSVIDDRGVDLELRPDEPDAIVNVARDRDEPGVGPLTTVHVRDRFRPGLVLEFLASLRDEIAEARILREHCRWSPIPVFVDGRPISTTLTLPADARVRVAIDRDGIRGEAGFVDAPDARASELEPRVDLVAAGVFVTGHPLPGFPAGFRAIVDAPLLRTDISRNDFVRDAAYAAFRDVLDDAVERALVALADRMRAQSEPAPAWCLAMIRSTLARRGPIERLGLDARAATPKLAAIPVWPTSDRMRSTAELRGAAIEYVTRGLERGLPPGWDDVVLAQDIVLRRDLLALFGSRAVDRTAELDAAVERLSRRDAFLGRTFPRTLGPGAYLGRWWIKTDRLSGEVGIRRGGDEDAAVRFLVDGRLLESHRFDPRALPVRGLVAIVEGPFQPNPEWDRAARDDLLADALLEIATSVHGLLAQEAAALGATSPPEDLLPVLRPYLARVARGRFEDTFFAAMGFAHEAARAHMQARRHTPPSVGLTSPFASLRMFDTADGRTLCLREIDRERAGGPVHVTTTARGTLDAAPHLVLHVDRDGQRILEAAFPDAVIVDAPDLRTAASARRDATSPAPAPDPTAALLDAVRAQLRAIGLARAADPWVDAIDARPHDSPALALPDGDRIVLNANHAAMRAVLAHRDPALVALATSSVLTALHACVPELDATELVDHVRRHAERVAAT